VRPSARPSQWAPEDPKHRDRFTKAERPAIVLACGTCGAEFRPKQYTKRHAVVNFCSQSCRLAWSRRYFNPGGYSYRPTP